MIGTIENDADAERFSDYLLAQGMENMVEESSSGAAWQVWVEHDDDLDRAKAELEAYVRNPSDAKYDAAGHHAERIRKDEEKKQRRLREKFIDVRKSWGQPAQWNAPLTMALVAISIIIGFATKLGEQMEPLGDKLLFASMDKREREARFEKLARNPRQLMGKSEDELRRLVLDPGLGQIAGGQVWRLVTPIFLHFSPIHLLFNLFWLLDLGRQIEVRRGTLRFAGLVLLSAVVSNVVQYFFSGPNFGGMSGVVYALLGYVYVKGKYEPHLNLGISPQSMMIMMVWLVLGFIGMLGDIANAAHLAGLVVGAAVAYAPIALRKLKHARRRLQ
jgi:GlpG protein